MLIQRRAEELWQRDADVAQFLSRISMKRVDIRSGEDNYGGKCHWKFPMGNANGIKVGNANGWKYQWKPFDNIGKSLWVISITYQQTKFFFYKRLDSICILKSPRTMEAIEEALWHLSTLGWWSITVKHSLG